MKWPEVSILDAMASAEVFVDGDWVESKDQDPEGDVRLLQLADVGDGEFIDKSDRFMTSAKARALRCTYLKPGDVMVARMPDPLGRACIFPGDAKAAVTVVDVCIIRPNAREYDARWLMHCLNAPDIRNQIAGYATGTTRSRISRGNLGKIKIPLMPLVEQRRIAEVLERAEAVRAKRRAALAQLDSLTPSLFLDLFGDPAANPKNWPRTTLGEIIEFVGGAQPPRETFTYEPSSDTIRLVQIRDFRTEAFKTYIPKKFARRYFETDDVMIGRYGPPVFQILRGLSGSYNVALMKAMPRGEVLKDFIFHLLQERRLHAFVVGRSERTAGQSGVNLELLENYPAYLPPLELQREFSRRATAVEALKTAQRASLAELDSLFATLQHNAFRGDL